MLGFLLKQKIGGKPGGMGQQLLQGNRPLVAGHIVQPQGNGIVQRDHAPLDGGQGQGHGGQHLGKRPHVIAGGGGHAAGRIRRKLTVYAAE